MYTLILLNTTSQQNTVLQYWGVGEWVVRHVLPVCAVSTLPPRAGAWDDCTKVAQWFHKVADWHEVAQFLITHNHKSVYE